MSLPIIDHRGPEFGALGLAGISLAGSGVQAAMNVFGGAPRRASGKE
jgi:hypothetical protein